MLVAGGALPTLLLAILVLFDTERTTVVAEPLDDASQYASLSSAFHGLNVSVGGRLNVAVPFEQACFSILEGQHVNVSAAACADVQGNYTNPLYRAAHFSAYMTVRSSFT